MAEILAQTMGLPFLGGVPITPGLRINSDAGDPTANWDDDALATSFDTLLTHREPNLRGGGPGQVPDADHQRQLTRNT